MKKLKRPISSSLKKPATCLTRGSQTFIGEIEL